jgi:thiamine biosynthesis lipoprotein
VAVPFLPAAPPEPVTPPGRSIPPGEAIPPGPASARGMATPPGYARHVFRAMGTSVTVVLPEPDAALTPVVEELFSSWEAALSRFRPESELSRLNASADRSVRVSWLLLNVIEAALRAARATDGVFDPALEPMLRALGYDRTFDDLPSDGPTPTPARPGGAWRAIEVNRDAGTVRLPSGCALDLGGIAKGMAVDAAVAELARRGVSSAVVEAGGDLAVAGLPPGSPAWPVALEGLDGQRDVAIVSGALATSGVSRRSWLRGGLEQHHLLDPRTGAPAMNELWSVTAAALSCAQAEVAAKSAFVLGRAAGAQLLLRLGISALLVGRDGSERLVGPWADQPPAAASAPEPLLAPRGLA